MVKTQFLQGEMQCTLVETYGHFRGTCYLHLLGRRWYRDKVSSECCSLSVTLRGGSDKSLARPGRKQATATKVGIYSRYSPWSSIHFLACCSNFCKPLKKKFRRLSNQPGLRGSSDLCVGWKMATFQMYFQSREQVVVWRGQVRRIGWVIKTLDVHIGQFLLGCKCPVSRGIVVPRTRPPWWPSRGVFPSKCPSIAPAEISNTSRW